MREQTPRLNDLHAAVLVISFESPAALRRFHWFGDLPFLVVSDQSRRLYNSFGLRSRPLHRLFDRETMKTYAHELLRGHLPPWPRADLRQLGGDVVLNQAGDVVFVHRSATPADRPSVETLLQVLRADGQ